MELRDRVAPRREEALEVRRYGTIFGRSLRAQRSTCVSRLERTLTNQRATSIFNPLVDHRLGRYGDAMSDILHNVHVRSSKAELMKALNTIDGLSSWWTSTTEGSGA
jgi:hypothetical protein